VVIVLFAARPHGTFRHGVTMSPETEGTVVGPITDVVDLKRVSRLAWSRSTTAIPMFWHSQSYMLGDGVAAGSAPRKSTLTSGSVHICPSNADLMATFSGATSWSRAQDTSLSRTRCLSDLPFRARPPTERQGVLLALRW
jgi:hypothetical protein